MLPTYDNYVDLAANSKLIATGKIFQISRTFLNFPSLALQIEDPYKDCWANATASMLRNSMRLKIKNAPISTELRDQLLDKLNDKDHHHRMRCELMMVVTPTRMTNDDNQGAVLALVMERVNTATADTVKSHMFFFGFSHF